LVATSDQRVFKRARLEAGARHTRDIPDTAEITPDILGRWSTKVKLELPSISELPAILDKPLPEDEKVPLTCVQFDNLLSGLMETRDICRTDDVKRLFRVTEEEIAMPLFLILYNAVMDKPPPDDGTEASFISFWDRNIREILELLLPLGRSIRDSNDNTDTQKLRPDYGFLVDGICLFRGEQPTMMILKPSCVISSFGLIILYRMSFVSIIPCIYLRLYSLS
jgi:hypothetical protein